MSRPVAVLISDIHFTPSTLDLASNALRMAQDRAMKLRVPLIIAGDTLDSKAVMRAECVNELIEIFTGFRYPPETYILVGNHDLLNEKASEHSLKFLEPHIRVISDPTYLPHFPALIPYQTDAAVLKNVLEDAELKGYKIIICHQGVQTAYMGHYTQDKTSLPKEAFANFRVISGHYHRRQTIECGPLKANMVGRFDYIGNPYTQNFGEASDPEKGFQILHDDGILEFVSTKLRKHLVIEAHVDDLQNGEMAVKDGDLIWLKLSGPKSSLDLIDKQALGMSEFGHSNYKLDLIPTDSEPLPESKIKDLSEAEVFDRLIDNTPESEDSKTFLKALWRQTIESI